MSELIESATAPGHFHVEKIVEDGAIEVAVFSGPNAETRANDYLDWRNEQEP